MKRIACIAAVGVAVLASVSFAAGSEGVDILKATGVRGGIVVHLGCGDGKLTAQLRASDAYTVHGLDANETNVAAARARLTKAGLYGPVSVECLTGASLPYADRLVNLVVVENPRRVTVAEIMRVLVPGGVAYVKKGDAWTKTVKPQSDQLDEWSHYLHDAGNNAVAKDTVVGPPRRLQWVVSPLFLRSHETASGISAQIAAGGRLFYIFDEGPIGIVDERLPSRWSIVCRDAFNGKLLWKRPMPNWGWQAWSKSRFEGKDWTVVRARRVSAPSENNRRLVAEGDRLYATLGHRAPLSILDAGSGKVLFTVKGTAPTQEILASEGVVLAHVKKPGAAVEGRRGGRTFSSSTLVAVAGKTGKVLWREDVGEMIGSYQIAISDGKVFYRTSKTMVCRSLRGGKQLWKTEIKTAGKNFVAASGVVLILGGTTLESYDAADGKKLWQNKIPPRSGGEGPDLFVTGNLVWPGMVPVDKAGKASRKSDAAMAMAFDVRTGERKKRIVVKNFRSPEHHHRCYRNKATSRYIISGMEGAEYLDMQGDGHEQNNWLRGACKEGVMPCYGMLYVPADQCFCQPGGKLLGYTAVAPAAAKPTPPIPDANRLEKGPAYAAIRTEESPARDAGDWRTYRYDAGRHGSTPAAVECKVAPVWRMTLSPTGPGRTPARLTQPVTAGGKVFVASIDAHTVFALNAATGKGVWQFTAGGRIDSPPTLHGPLVLFGSADGRVYCVRQSDGALVWRFLAAPHDRRVGGFGQIESAWPVHGSVLVHGGIAYVAAGRSTYLDDGMQLWGLDPMTGAIKHKGKLAGPHRTIDGQRDVAFYVPGANSDVLVAEGGHIYMRQKKVTPDLKEVDPKVLSSKGEKDVGLHVFSTSGLLDGSWYNRTFWMYSKRWPGFQLANQAPKAGQLLVVDETATYALRVYYRRNCHSPMFFPGKEGYLLFADKNTTEPQIVGEAGARPPIRWLPQSDYSTGRSPQGRKLEGKAFGMDKGIGYTRADKPLWMLWLPVRVRAMVKTRDILFAAGPPDEFDPAAPFAALEGKRGAVLVAISAKEGKKLTELKLDTEPVFDGMIAVEGRLFVSLIDGSVMCLSGTDGK